MLNKKGDIMSNYSYSYTVTTTDKELGERMLKSYKSYPKEIEVLFQNRYTLSVGPDVVDLAVLFGIREYCYGEESCEPLTEIEKQQLSNLIGSPTNWDERLVRLRDGASFAEKEGEFGIHLFDYSNMETWCKLSLLYPEATIVFKEQVDDDASEEMSYSVYTYEIKNGAVKLIKEYHTDDY